MIVEEETRRDVEGNEHIDRVMLVCGEDEEDAEHVHHPRCNVYIVEPLRDVCKKAQQKQVIVIPKNVNNKADSYACLCNVFETAPSGAECL